MPAIRTHPSLTTLPSKEKSYQLPKRIHAQTTWHDRVVFKMALEKPQIWIQIKLGDNFPFSVFTAFVADMHDTVEHQHGWQRKLCVPGTEHLAVTAVEQFLVCETLLHGDFRRANSVAIMPTLQRRYINYNESPGQSQKPLTQASSTISKCKRRGPCAPY